METIGQCLKNRLRQKSTLAKQVQASLIVEFANEKIVEFWGKKGAEQARAVSLKSQILKIHCDNSIIAQEMNFKKMRLLSCLEKKFGGGAVQKLKIVQSGAAKREDIVVF